MSPHNLLWGALAVAAYLIAQALFDRRQRRRKGAVSVSKTSADSEASGAVKPRLFSGVRLAAVALALVLGTVGSFVYDDLTRPGTAPSTAQSPLPKVPDAEPIMRSFVQQAQVTFGPFETIAVSPGVSTTSDMRFPAILMMYQDGRTEASQQWTIPFPAPEWARADMSPVAAITVKESDAAFRVDFDRAFAVRVSQPFIIETHPTKVYAIDALRNVWVLDMMQAAAMRQFL